ncbi:HNH endonuclease [Actinobacillus equuli]|uniref:HNH endonuclease n=1 Tax=Actinobacillus equuli TaxID=718 RepID=UPI0024418010|nr:HNH endonuclease [Actinobacillus equuli]WGE47865.1 HNH endonuclease [Actinobacillus equuli subsp. equuli]
MNQAIKQLTEQSETANIAAHVLWGAIEAELAGGKASTGAVAAGAAEIGARVLTQGLYEKEPHELTTEEKEEVLALSKALAGLASGAVNGGSSVETLNAVSAGVEVAKNAVENNALSSKDVAALYRDIRKAIENGEDVEAVYKHYRQLSQAQREALLSDCGESCRLPVEGMLGNATELAVDYSGLIWGWMSGLSTEERSRFLMLVEEENARTISELKDNHTLAEKAFEMGLDTARMMSKEGDLSNSSTKKTLYSPKQTREKVEGAFGEQKVKSTTVVKNARSTVTERTLKTGESVHIIESEGGKAIQVKSKPDEFGNTKLLANIPYDSRGLPVFDDVAAFTTKIEKFKNYQNMKSEARRIAEMKNATRSLKNAINKGEVNKNLFSKEQLEQINKGSYKIEGFTWHHNAQSGPNNMQLVPEKIHDAVKHTGEGALSEGR